MDVPDLKPNPVFLIRSEGGTAPSIFTPGPAISGSAIQCPKMAVSEIIRDFFKIMA